MWKNLALFRSCQGLVKRLPETQRGLERLNAYMQNYTYYDSIQYRQFPSSKENTQVAYVLRKIGRVDKDVI